MLKFFQIYEGCYLFFWPSQLYIFYTSDVSITKFQNDVSLFELVLYYLKLSIMIIIMISIKFIR